MDFLKDKLERQIFADVLIGYASSLASANAAPSGRVIAVDAPWGSGKSWLAKRLPTHFENDKKVGKCIYIDAFEFDYQKDPFAVVTSAILNNYKNDLKAIRNFKLAAINVIKTSLPVLGKSLIKAGVKVVGVDSDSLVEGILDAGSDASDKAIEKMLATFSETKATTESFKKKLTELAQSNGENAPLIVIIDELDRCRPTFALELLERVKHLFDVPNVVFILFIHTPALHSSIRKTYGQDINPSEYLKKFISITLGLPIAQTNKYYKTEQVEFIRRFVETQYPAPPDGLAQGEVNFRTTLIDISAYFNASFRDIENVMLLWQLINRKIQISSQYIAYGLLLKICDPKQLKSLQDNNIAGYENEILRLGSANDNENYTVKYFREFFEFRVGAGNSLNPSSQITSEIQNHNNSHRYFTHALKSLELEYLKI
ncbi:MAG TPA: P-loop NTPase fold protein [Burkholderiaceae bacterium]|nr:P-loop NTPase fold protein [Burkholderiaceae bacterium]